MKKDNYLKHFLTISSGSLINMVLGLLTTPIITRMVAPDAYGRLSVYNIYVNIGMFVFCLGMDQVLVRYFYNSDDEKYKRSLIYKSWLIPAIVMMVVGVALIVLTYSNVIVFEEGKIYSVLLVVGVFSQVAYRIGLMVVRLQYKSKSYAIITALYKVFYLILAIVLLVTLKQNHFLILVIATVASTIMATVISLLIERKMWIPIKGNYGVSCKEMLRFGLPFIVSLGISAFYSATDKICIKFLCNYDEVGIYASATNIIAIFGIVQTAFNALWGPMATDKYNKDPEDTVFHRNGCQYVTIVMFLFGLTLILFKDIIVLLLGEEYSQAVYILPFLTLYPIMYTISETTVGGINFKKKSYWHVVIAAVSCIINLAGNLVLIPIMGSKGAAVSTGLSYVVLFLMRTTISMRLYPVRYDIVPIGVMVILTCVFALYNTYFVVDWISVLMYIIIVVVMVIMYQNAVKKGLQILKNEFFKGGQK